MNMTVTSNNIILYNQPNLVTYESLKLKIFIEFVEH